MPTGVVFYCQKASKNKACLIPYYISAVTGSFSYSFPSPLCPPFCEFCLTSLLFSKTVTLPPTGRALTTLIMALKRSLWWSRSRRSLAGQVRGTGRGHHSSRNSKMKRTISTKYSTTSSKNRFEFKTLHNNSQGKKTWVTHYFLFVLGRGL